MKRSGSPNPVQSSKKSQIVDVADGSSHIQDTENKKPYTITRVKEKRVRKYHVEEITFRATFNKEYEGRDLLSITDNIHSMFEDIMENVEQDHPNNEDKARLNIRHAGLERDIVVHCQPKHNITASTIMQR